MFSSARWYVISLPDVRSALGTQDLRHRILPIINWSINYHINYIILKFYFPYNWFLFSSGSENRKLKRGTSRRPPAPPLSKQTSDVADVDAKEDPNQKSFADDSLCQLNHSKGDDEQKQEKNKTGQTYKVEINCENFWLWIGGDSTFFSFTPFCS